MEGFPPIQNATLSRSSIRKLRSHFKWISFSDGEVKLMITPSGGVHYSGKPEIYDCVIFEIDRGGYITIALYEYPKGVIFHPHIGWNAIDRKSKDGWKLILDKVYNDIRNILLERI